MAVHARTVAYEILSDIYTKNAYANIAIHKAFQHFDLSNEDKHLVMEIVYGCTKMQLHLDTIINSYCKLGKKDYKTLIILRMAVYQLLFLERIPEHAAINEAVNLAKSANLKTTNLINAVLRGIQRQDKEVVWPDKRKQRNQFISKWYSFPQWMVDKWVKDFGFSNTEKLCQYFNQPTDIWIRVNHLLESDDNVLRALDDANIAYKQHEFLKQAIKLGQFQAITDSNLFKNGLITIQDFSSMLPPLVLSPEKDWNILDMCASPGGKTAFLADLMENTGKIIACDLHSHRVKLMKNTLDRLHVKNVECITHDACCLGKSFEENFDAILLDAPCSGLGVLNRRADLRWNKRLSDINEIIQLQSKLLNAAESYLVPNGHLIYSTCTINADENENQIEDFLKDHPDCHLEAFELMGEYCSEGYKTIYPFETGTDGFFIAKIRKWR